MSAAFAVSGLASKFEGLQERSRRRHVHQSCSVQIPSDNLASSKVDIGALKDFYLHRLAQSELSTATLLGSKLNNFNREVPVSKAGGQQILRPTFTPGALSDIEDLEVMCNNCFTLIRSSEASACTGTPSECPLACRSGAERGARPAGALELLDLKLRRLRGALEARLQDKSAKTNITRHLSQLRYHVETALKWSPGCFELGALTEHTIMQVKQLTMTARVIAPAVLVFSKRVENAVVQKERELRKGSMQQSLPSTAASSCAPLYVDPDDGADSVAEASSAVSELDSDCGTRCNLTVVTQDAPGNDVGNMQDVNDMMVLKSEDEQRRWFYSQCLNAKLACQDKERARKVLISELYTKVRAEGVPMNQWVPWIRVQLEG
mmetsp:Transcript_70731/g.207136  ORF Transcript_70731/g.207136 Transcript_70731/m.207136 type:complete len:378 (+) Transcript_70731:60-1193(+)